MRTRQTRAAWIAATGIALAALALGPASGCAESTSASHVRAGDLYAPGQDRYDDYFAAVHSQQATSAQWGGDRKSAHQAIAEAVKLDADASDDDLVRAAHAKHGSRAVAQAIEKTVRSDGERAKGLNEMAQKIDDLVKAGHALEDHVSADFGKPGSGASGPTPEDVRMELRASYDVLAKIQDRAKKEAKAAEDFLAALQQKGGKETRAASHAAPAKAAASPSPSNGAASSTTAPAPQPKPQPKPEGEVFQP